VARAPVVDPGGHHTARAVLHGVAVHVLARRRSQVSGRFGLRAVPGGITTPAFGEGPEVVRISGDTLFREVAGECSRVRIEGTTLEEIAALVDADLSTGFDCGADAPPLGRTDLPLHWPEHAVRTILDWFGLGWRVLDSVVASQPVGVTSATIQLWPEHFDAATTLTLPTGQKVNLGFSPGDGYEPEPYVYAGPWSDARPGDAAFWNAPFGALRRYAEVSGAHDPEAECRRFLEEGVRRVATEAH